MEEGEEELEIPSSLHDEVAVLETLDASFQERFVAEWRRLWLRSLSHHDAAAASTGAAAAAAAAAAADVRPMNAKKCVRLYSDAEWDQFLLLRVNAPFVRRSLRAAALPAVVRAASFRRGLT